MPKRPSVPKQSSWQATMTVFKAFPLRSFSSSVHLYNCFAMSLMVLKTQKTVTPAGNILKDANKIPFSSPREFCDCDGSGTIMGWWWADSSVFAPRFFQYLNEPEMETKHWATQFLWQKAAYFQGFNLFRIILIIAHESPHWHFLNIM